MTYTERIVTTQAELDQALADGRAKITGGTILDHTSRDSTDPRTWCEDNGVTISKAGVATLYKAVDNNWTTPRGTSYAPGTKPSCDDWSDTNDCGGGLHGSPSPGQAHAYHEEATRYVEMGVRLEDLRPIPGGTAKAKFPKVVRPCREVDLVGRAVSA